MPWLDQGIQATHSVWPSPRVREQESTHPDHPTHLRALRQMRIQGLSSLMPPTWL